MITTDAVPGRTHSPPRALAVAGMIFAVFMASGLCIIRLAIPDDPAHPGAWVADPASRNAVRFALNLVPFSGIAFLWFVGVFRDRVGNREDRFFATVFLGSSVLFVASLFGAAAIAGSLVEMVGAGETAASDHHTYYFGRWAADMFMNVFAIKMAGMFMFSSSTIALRTAILPRWVAFSGFVCGVILLLVITHWLWIALVFPIWVLLVSIEILLAGGEA